MERIIYNIIYENILRILQRGEQIGPQRIEPEENEVFSENICKLINAWKTASA